MNTVQKQYPNIVSNQEINVTLPFLIPKHEQNLYI